MPKITHADTPIQSQYNCIRILAVSSGFCEPGVRTFSVCLLFRVHRSMSSRRKLTHDSNELQKIILEPVFLRYSCRSLATCTYIIRLQNSKELHPWVLISVKSYSRNQIVLAGHFDVDFLPDQLGVSILCPKFINTCRNLEESFCFSKNLFEYQCP